MAGLTIKAFDTFWEKAEFLLEEYKRVDDRRHGESPPLCFSMYVVQYDMVLILQIHRPEPYSCHLPSPPETCESEWFKICCKTIRAGWRRHASKYHLWLVTTLESKSQQAYLADKFLNFPKP